MTAPAPVALPSALRPPVSAISALRPPVSALLSHAKPAAAAAPGSRPQAPGPAGFASPADVLRGLASAGATAARQAAPLLASFLGAGPLPRQQPQQAAAAAPSLGKENSGKGAVARVPLRQTKRPAPLVAPGTAVALAGGGQQQQQQASGGAQATKRRRESL